MEQKENKQKTQVAEEQVSCPPQQPVEPHPFISVIPLAVLITLIVMVVSYLDDQWRGSHINILWCTDHVADLFLTLRLHHLQHHFRDDGNLMDHHCHHRYCSDGNR